MNNDKNKRIEEILGSLDNCQRASVPDFFYTRLKAKMEVSPQMEIKRPLLLRPVYALTALALVLIVNAIVIFQNKQTTITDNTALSDAETFQSMAAEYSLNDNNAILFDINQEK